MPWVQIDPTKLDHLPLFGYDKVAEDGNFIWYSTPYGERLCVEKDDPRVLLEDINDIMQLNPKAILIVHSDGKPD
jgi:hypothetical protein